MKKSLPLKVACGLGFLSISALSYGADVAKIGDTAYPSLSEAFAAAASGQTITLCEDTDVSQMIPVTTDVKLALNGHTITNNVSANRLFRVSANSFEIAGDGGKVITPADNTRSFGFIDFRDASNTPNPSTSVKISDTSFEGIADDGPLFAFRIDGQSIENDNVNVNVTGGKTYSIINGHKMQVGITVKGGEYTYNSDVKNAGVFQAGTGSTIDFNGVKVNSSVGPVFEAINSTATFTNCDMTNTAANGYFATCIAASNGATVTVDGGTYKANYPVYVYNSGGTINIKDGTFEGNIAAIKVDDSTTANPSKVTVENGTFTGDVQVDGQSELTVEEGSFTADVSQYCVNGSNQVAAVDDAGNTVYVVLPADSKTVALVGTTPYESLSEAFAAATSGQTISLCCDTDVTAMIPVTTDVKLALNGHTITNNVSANRLFRVSADSFEIAGDGGKVITPADNTRSFGFIDFRDASNTPNPSTSVKISDTSFEGIADDGPLFAFRTDGQSIENDNVNVKVTGGKTYSIINGHKMQVGITVKGGEYTYNSDVKDAGVFQAGSNSTIDFNGVKVNSSVGPVFEAKNSTATFTNCDMTNTAANGYLATCIAASNGATVTVNGGTYKANYPVYVYNSGGTINIKDGTFEGNIAAIKVDDSTTANPSKVTVADGTFTGPLQIGNESELKLYGGTYTDEAAQNYCANGYMLVTNPDGTFGVELDPNDPTAIDSVEADGQPADGPVYNLHGVKVANSIKDAAPGLYIVNGKKELIK